VRYNSAVARTVGALSLIGMGFKVFRLFTPTDDGGCYCRESKNCSKPGKYLRVTRWRHTATSYMKRFF
jgi:hypothetical protein